MSNELAALREQGYVILPELLGSDELAEIREALAPQLLGEVFGRNNFEGLRTERVYGLVGKGAPFERLAEHPRIMALCDALLLPNFLLTASQAIRIHPGETAQPWHTDDAFYRVARPRRAISVAVIVAIDPFTLDNGATQLVVGSHTWDDRAIDDVLTHILPDFMPPAPGAREPRPPSPLPAALEAQVIDAVMPAGSALFFVGTLLHRGGENRSAAPRLALTNQYCEPWARQQENFMLSVPRERAAAMSDRLKGMLGYSIHPPFMGHVGGRHPARLLG